MSISLHSMKTSKLSIIDTDNNVHLFNIDEKVSLGESEIKFIKTLYPYVVLFDSNMELIKEANEYLKSKLSRGQEINTALAKGYDLKHFYNFINQEKLYFANVKPRHINDFITYLIHPDNKGSLVLYAQSKRTGKTINRIISTVRDFYRYLNVFYGVDTPFENESVLINSTFRNGLLAHTQKGKNSKSIYKAKELEKDIKILTFKEYKTISNYFKINRDLLMFQFMFFTGARIGEALSLKIQNLKNIDATKKVQTIELTETIDNEDNRRRLKTGTRKLFVPTWLYLDLNEYYNTDWSKTWDEIEFEHDYFFIGLGNRNKGKALAYSTMSNKFREISKKLNIKFTAHTLRHTFATNLARKKVDISVIQKLLGHKNPSTCSIYIQLAKEQDIVKELEKIFDESEYV